MLKRLRLNVNMELPHDLRFSHKQVAQQLENVLAGAAYIKTPFPALCLMVGDVVYDIFMRQHYYSLTLDDQRETWARKRKWAMEHDKELRCLLVVVNGDEKTWQILESLDNLAPADLSQANDNPAVAKENDMEPWPFYVEEGVVVVKD